MGSPSLSGRGEGGRGRGSFVPYGRRGDAPGRRRRRRGARVARARGGREIGFLRRGGEADLLLEPHLVAEAGQLLLGQLLVLLGRDEPPLEEELADPHGEAALPLLDEALLERRDRGEAALVSDLGVDLLRPLELGERLRPRGEARLLLGYDRARDEDLGEGEDDALRSPAFLEREALLHRRERREAVPDDDLPEEDVRVGRHRFLPGETFLEEDGRAGASVALLAGASNGRRLLGLRVFRERAMIPGR